MQYVDTSEIVWRSGPNERLAPLDDDMRYRITTLEGQRYTLVAHLGDDFGRHWLNARSEDRSRAYEDCEAFCEFTLEETGQRGAGVLEIGTYLEGPGIADTLGKPKP